MSTTPRVRILSTGSEITTGLYADTNAQRLSQILLAEGFAVISHGAVPDDRSILASEIKRVLHDADLVVSTGGLGPTEDDLNREVIAEILGTALHEDAEALAMMRERFCRRGIPMPEKNKVQALIPDGAIMIRNEWGTAPGFLVPPAPDRAAFLALPGPSSEWQPMMRGALRDHLDGLFPGRPASHLHGLHIAMTPESLLNDALRDLFHRPDIDLTILAGRGVIRLRLLSRQETKAKAIAVVEEVREEILRRVGREILFEDGDPDKTLAAALLDCCREHGATLATAESCTGGMVSARLTDVAGSSDVYLGGYVTYSNAAKERDLGVDSGLLATHGAVSSVVARAMAEGARNRTGASVAVAVTGIAGPGGGSDEKPVGLVYFAVAGLGESIVIKRRFSGDRSLIREWATNQSLELVRRYLLGIDPDIYLAGANPRRMNT